MSRIIVVDERDNIIGYKERKDRLSSDIIRVTGLMVYNSKDELLLAQRVHTKKYDPGKWGPAAAGTVEEGETHEDNVIKEAEEEIGLVVDPGKLIKGPCKMVGAETGYFVQRFFYKSDLPIEDFKIREDEVAEIKWMDISNLIKDIEKHPADYIPAFKGSDSIINDFLNFRNKLD